MANRQTFLSAEWAERFKKSYAALSPDRKKRCDETCMALIKRETSPGLRIKPVEPDKYFFEARINDGDRLIFRPEAEKIIFVDIVKHDDIKQYGRRPKGHS